MLDRKMVNTDISFNMEKNIQNIKELFSGEGKSGEFFYFSTDNKLLIKTLKEDEKN